MKFFRMMMLVLWIVAFSCKSKVESTLPTRENITESVYASGFVKSNNQYQVFAKSSGVIEKIWVKEGDIVKRGQVLFSLSNQVSKLSADNAQLAASNAELRSNMDKLNELSLNIEVGKKKMDNDFAMLKRQQRLWEEQIGTKLELEQRELAYTNSKSTYESAKLRYTELQRQLNFAANQSQKNLSISKTMLDDYNVRSEVDGKVYSIAKELGEMVNPQVPLAVVGDASDFKLILQVDENDIVKVAVGQNIKVSMDSYKGQVFEAVLDKINPIMNERSRTFEVEAHFLKGPSTMYPNLTLEANIVLNTKNEALTIPRKFLLDDDYVFISLKEKRKVKIGLRDFQKAEVLEGLTTSDKIYMPSK
jgi:HlyD family secretion protein